MVSNKRIKTVFSSNDEVAHVWASQTQPHGRTANMFFETDSIYSYGRHYLAAKIFTSKDGNKLVLVNNYMYSNTTGKHLRAIQSACSNRTTLSVPDVSSTNEQKNEEYLYNEVCKSIEYVLGRTKYSSIDNIDLSIKNLNILLEWNNKKKFELPQDMRDVLVEIQKEKDNKNKQKDELKKELERQKQADLIKKYKFQIEAWKYHSNSDHIPYSVLSGLKHDIVRVTLDGTQVETNRGAKVPIYEVKKALMMALNGSLPKYHRLGSYIIDGELQGDLITIGCHTVSISQVQDALGTHALELTKYLENECAFRDYEILPKSLFGTYNKIAVHQVVDKDSIEHDVQNALHNFRRDWFSNVVFYV